MKVVIFAGGLGTRIAEETDTRPKPMVEIGGKPVLWHIMKIYSHYGFNEFIVCLGYKGYVIKEYFMNYFLHNADLTIDVANNKVEIHDAGSEAFKVTLVETGASTKTAGRLQKVKKYIGNVSPDFDYNYNKKLVEHAKAMGKSGVSIIADKGTFPFKQRIDDLINFELSLPSKYDIDLKRICVYYQKDFNRLAEEQRQKLINHHVISIEI